MDELKKEVSFKAEGFVYGEFWGGEEGSYPSITLGKDSYEELITEAETGVKEGWLNNKINFMRLIGARLIIEKTSKVTLNKKKYVRVEVLSKPVYIGNLTLKQKRFLSSLQ